MLKTMSRKQIKLSEIVLEEHTQPRVNGLDERHINELVKHSDPAAWPPIMVDLSGAYRLIDGHHRYEAAKRLALETLVADVLSQDGADYEKAFEANSAHGLQLTPEDRKNYARYLRETYPQISEVEISSILMPPRPRHSNSRAATPE